jgi:hypothetical protein
MAKLVVQTVAARLFHPSAFKRTTMLTPSHSHLYLLTFQECGSNYTAKLEGMFQDIDLSRECQAAFTAHLAKPGTATGAGMCVWRVVVVVCCVLWVL